LGSWQVVASTISFPPVSGIYYSVMTVLLFIALLALGSLTGLGGGVVIVPLLALVFHVGRGVPTKRNDGRMRQWFSFVW
jgi:hypothetical protein